MKTRADYGRGKKKKKRCFKKYWSCWGGVPGRGGRTGTGLAEQVAEYGCQKRKGLEGNKRGEGIVTLTNPEALNKVLGDTKTVTTSSIPFSPPKKNTAQAIR